MSTKYSGKMVKQVEFLYNNGKGGLTTQGISFYSRIGMRRTKVIIKALVQKKMLQKTFKWLK